jgi:transcriptional regulator with XRE-family HTH domain
MRYIASFSPRRKVWYYPRTIPYLPGEGSLMSETARSPPGDFLRSWRERLSPEAVGLAGGRRRRTAGLRREEVAELAGIGVDWYIRLEQGRSVRPSPTTIDALARALNLSKVERAHLRALRGSGERHLFRPETIPESLKRMIDALDQPAYIKGRRWDLLAWNTAASEIFAFDRLAEEDRNVLVSMLTREGARKLFGDAWAEEAKRMVAQFRGTHDLWADDPAFRDLIERLRQGCPEFTKWWKGHDIRNAGTGEKVLNHPTKGVLRFEHASFQANDDPAFKLIIYTPI